MAATATAAAAAAGHLPFHHLIHLPPTGHTPFHCLTASAVMASPPPPPPSPCSSSSTSTHCSAHSRPLKSFDIPHAPAEARRFRARIVKSRLEEEEQPDVLVGNRLLTMCGKRGRVEDARGVFDKMPRRDVVSWSAMIGIYAQNGHCEQALQLFRQMQLHGFRPNKVTFLNALNACAMSAVLANGKLIHALILDSGFETDTVLGTAIIKMYGKCGNLEAARRMFHKLKQPNIVSWTTVIGAYAQHNFCDEAIHYFQQMQLDGTLPNAVTFLAVLDACSNSGALAQGKVIHAHIIESGFESHIVIKNALIYMYGKCGSLDNARRIFDNMPERDVVSWNAMIALLVQHGNDKEALQLFHQMQVKALMPSKVTFISVLDACADMAALEEGKLIHLQLLNRSFESDVNVGNAIINMYGKCGSLKDARRTFDKMKERDIISWNAMIAAYAQHGHGKEALELFQQMQLEAVSPNEVTFISVLSACSHTGLVNEGRRFFASMSNDHGITPTLKHYGCMIDLFARAGRLNEAEGFLFSMPFQPDAVTWTTLLGAYRMHGEVEHGKHAAERVLELDPKNDGAYISLSNIYASVRRWDDVEKVRKSMADGG